MAADHPRYRLSAVELKEWGGVAIVGSTAWVRFVVTLVENEDLGLRIRDVVQGPDGALCLLTDEGDGEILRVGPIGRTTEGG